MLEQNNDEDWETLFNQVESDDVLHIPNYLWDMDSFMQDNRLLEITFTHEFRKNGITFLSTLLRQ